MTIFVKKQSSKESEKDSVAAGKTNWINFHLSCYPSSLFSFKTFFPKFETRNTLNLDNTSAECRSGVCACVK